MKVLGVLTEAFLTTSECLEVSALSSCPYNEENCKYSDTCNALKEEALEDLGLERPPIFWEGYCPKHDNFDIIKSRKSLLGLIRTHRTRAEVAV